jgi:hypothetical protein
MGFNRDLWPYLMAVLRGEIRKTPEKLQLAGG